MQSPAHNSGTSYGSTQSRAIVPSFKLICDELDRVKKLIDDQLAVSACAGTLLSYLRKQVGGGKMLRPGLVLLAGASCGEVTDKHIRISAVVEMIHNATLLHDDVMDEGRRRRGEATANSLWGNESAVLLGDFLLSNVFKMCADVEPEVTRVIAATAVRICEGELRQIVQRQNWQLGESEYIDIITEKSAALFSCCCYLGGLLAGAGETQVRLLADYGLNFGIAFQITDDVLDLIGDEGEMGKTLGSDVDKSKLTLPVIHLLREIGEKRTNAVRSKLTNAPGRRKVLVEMLKSHGSLEYAHSRAQAYVAKAIAALADLKESSAKKALVETAGFVARRTI